MYKKNCYRFQTKSLLLIAVSAIILPVFCSEDEQVSRAVPWGFFEAVGCDDVQQMEQMLRTTPRLVHARVRAMWYTPLHNAADWGQLQAVYCLLRHGADVHAENLCGETPLHLAAKGGHLDVVKVLLQHAPQLRDAKEMSDETALHVAAKAGRRDIVEYLLDHGADVESRDKYGNTPLAIMAKIGALSDEKFWKYYQDIFALLLRRGARIDTQDQEQNTLMHIAVENSDCLALVRFLVENGVPIDAQNKDGSTPLLKASLGGHLAVAKFLIDLGADVDKRSKNRTRSIHGALRRNNRRIADALVKAGADIYDANHAGETPLLAALFSMFHPRDEIVQWILEFGVPFQNDQEIKELNAMQENENRFDVRKAIRDRRREIEEVLFKPSGTPAIIQVPVGYLARNLWRPVAAPFKWSLLRKRLPGIAELPDDVIKLIIEYMVTPDLPALEEVNGDASGDNAQGVGH